MVINDPSNFKAWKVLETDTIHLKPMNNPLGVSPSKGKQEPHEAKKKSFDLGGNRTHDLRIRSTVTSHRGQKIFSLPRVVFSFPLLGLTPSGLFMGLSSTIIYTSEFILCSTIYLGSKITTDGNSEMDVLHRLSRQEGHLRYFGTSGSLQGLAPKPD